MPILQFKFYMSCYGGIYGGEGGGLHMIQCLLFVWSGVKLAIIHYIDVYDFYVFYHIYITIILFWYSQRCFITVFKLFHPHTWIMKFCYIFMSNCIPKYFIIFGLIWCNCGGVDIHCVNIFFFKLNFAYNMFFGNICA